MSFGQQPLFTRRLPRFYHLFMPPQDDGMEQKMSDMNPISEAYMDKVITIHDYLDGINLGMATLNGKPCIYESDYWENGGDYFYLTPIDDDVFDMVFADWERWIQYMEKHQSAEKWIEQNEFNLRDIAKQSKRYRQYAKRGSFSGSYENFHTHIDNLNVVWSDSL